jgi:hypothetical protein
MNDAHLSAKNDQALQALSRVARELTTGLTLVWGETSRRTDGRNVVTADPLDEIDGDGTQGFLLTVFSGFPPPEQVWGLPWRLFNEAGTLERAGFTDRRGQALIEGLAEGIYRLAFEGLAWQPVVARVDVPTFAAAAAGTGEREQKFHLRDGTIQSRLAIDSHGHLLLEVRLAREVAGAARLASFRLTSQNHRIVSQGFVGLFESDDEWLYGEIDLDALTDDRLREEITRDRTADGDRLNVSVFPQSADDLTQADEHVRADYRASLERSIGATYHAVSRQALENALNRLGD